MKRLLRKAQSEQVETSKRAMSKLGKMLGHPDRISKLAYDIVDITQDSVVKNQTLCRRQ